MFSKRDEFWMRKALALAKQGAQVGEVPVGAVIVLNDEVIGEGFNAPITKKDPSAHAEIIAMRHAAQKIDNYRLMNATLYVTLEPCGMCASAMVHARIQRLVYGAVEPKAGAIVSKSAVLEQEFLNHKVVHSGGLLADTCGELLSRFFQERRKGGV